MELYFFRHGIAADREDPEYPDDRVRPLTEEGVRKTREAAEGLKRLELSFDKILTSPWLRAKQTADILAKSLRMANHLEVLPELAGDRSSQELVKALGDHHVARLLLVGHEPLLSATMAHLLCSAGEFTLDLKKSGVGAIEIEALAPPQSATLLWLLTSKQLRLVGK
jgi:phosphohistidine phosphatase